MEIESVNIKRESETPVYIKKRLDLRPINWLIDNHGAKVVQLTDDAVHVQYIDTDEHGVFISTTKTNAFMEFAEINRLRYIGVAIKNEVVSALFYL
jgi:hypothetical protein